MATPTNETEIKMSLATITVYNTNFDVYYTATRNKDPLGTGDSPTEIEVEITEIEDVTGCQNLLELLSGDVVEKIRQEVVKYEFDN